MTSSKSTGSLDIFRMIAAFLIVAIHTSPLLTFGDTADFILTRIIARVAVPFFFVVTGYFMYPHIEKGDNRYVRTLCKKITVIYAISIIVYLPLNLYAEYFNKPGLLWQITRDILFDGTFYHLWYLPAVLLGVPLVTVLIQRIGLRKAFIVSTVFYMIGLFGDSYYGIAKQIPGMKGFYDFIFMFSDYTRNGLFFAPIFLVMGAGIFNSKKRISFQRSIDGLIVSAVFLLVEGLLLHFFLIQRHDSMYVMLLPCMYFLFLMLLTMKGKNSKNIRIVSMLIYILHPWMIVIVRGFAKVTHLQKLSIDNSLIHYLAVSILSLAVAWIINYLWRKRNKPIQSKDGRAWVEINLSALRHNAKVLQEMLPKQCKLMAVVKANAYGHGDVEVAKSLNREGIRAFAVATLEEGIHLRKNGIDGEILILGYTNPCDIARLLRFHLTQTVIDYTYGKVLNDADNNIKVHIKIDTGMHRLGADADNISDIENIFKLRNLKIEGVFSHLCVSDSLTGEDIAYTQLQIERFFRTIHILNTKGYATGKLHIQASYGILNYPSMPCDYARAGIALYGVLSGNGRTHIEADLVPVLSVRARIAMVKHVTSGESVSYGRQFTANADIKIAIVTIGYADGIPRNLSDTNSYVLLHSQKAPIIGRICMDQLVIDVTYIDTVEQDDIVTLIGHDGDEQIYCEEFAKRGGTITNEILCRLGNRLNYIYV